MKYMLSKKTFTLLIKEQIIGIWELGIKPKSSISDTKIAILKIVILAY